MSQEELHKAVRTLCKALKEDEGYYFSWQSNIAVAMNDVLEPFLQNAKGIPREDLLKKTNEGAKRFLDFLLYVDSIGENL